MLREMQLVWRFNRGHTDALREIYEQHKHALVTLRAEREGVTATNGRSGPVTNHKRRGTNFYVAVPIYAWYCGSMWRIRALFFE
jgi:hypothetical protein